MSRWIESHQGIVSHPKLFKLATLSGMSPDVCIAKLHRLWWWALQYAEDGHLDKYTPEEIGFGIGIEDTEVAKNYYVALKATRWIDEFDRLNDWLDYAGRYLKSKYHTANPLKYKEILDMWIGAPKGAPKGKAKKKNGLPKGDQPNLPTKPTIPTIIPDGVSIETWAAFLEIRRSLKAPNTEHAMNLLSGRLKGFQEKGMSPEDVVNRSIENGWKGVFELKINKQEDRNDW